QGPAAFSTYSAMACAPAAADGRRPPMSAATPPVAGPFKTGLDWVYRSVLLLRQNPAKWLAQALLYTMLFVLLPTVPGMPVVVSLLILLLWPPILALFIGVYREADLGRHTEPRQLLEEMKPNMV